MKTDLSITTEPSGRVFFRRNHLSLRVAYRWESVGDLYDNFTAPVRRAFDHFMPLASLIEP